MRRPQTLVGFLLARIEEEETAALDSRSWYHGGEALVAAPAPAPKATRVSEPFAAFVLAHDPDRVLTECVAKRRMIKLLTGPRWDGSVDSRESLLRLLALPYASHPGFHDAWRGDTSDSRID